MNISPRSLFHGLLGSLVVSGASAATTDPVGYSMMNLMAGKKGSLPAPLANGYRILGSVTAAGDGFVEFGSNAPPDLLGDAQSACLDIRGGTWAGLSLKVTGFSGRRVTYEPAMGVTISPGTTVGVRPDWSLAGLLGSPPYSAMMQGESYQTSDIIGLLDPRTQETREFFYQAGAGWREVGSEAEGDRGNTAIPFRSSLQFFRRGTTDLLLVVTGTVPMYDCPQHWVRVWPGRNLLTTPFTASKQIQNLLEPSSLVSGRSAPKSDTFRLVYENASLSPVLYHHVSDGWTSVGGGNAPAEDTPVELSQVMDFNRVGPEGYLRFNTFPAAAQMARAVAGLPVEEVPVDAALSDFPRCALGWQSVAGTTYQVQVRPLGANEWSDLGDQVLATGAVCQATCQPQGQGIFRVIVR